MERKHPDIFCWPWSCKYHFPLVIGKGDSLNLRGPQDILLAVYRAVQQAMDLAAGLSPLIPPVEHEVFQIFTNGSPEARIMVGGELAVMECVMVLLLMRFDHLEWSQRLKGLFNGSGIV